MSVAANPQDAAGTTRRNVPILFLISILIGLGVAVYEVALPLHLKKVGLSWRDMGWIYAAGALAICFVRFGMGAWSDRVGRKLVYTLSLVAVGVSTALTPFFANAYVQLVLRSVALPAARVRDTMHSVLLYEDSRRGFLNIFSKTRGVEYLFHFVGLLLAGWGIDAMRRNGVASPHAWVIWIAAAVLVLAGLVFGTLYRERARRGSGGASLSWTDLLSPRLSRPMWVMTASIFVFTLGIMISHCFALQLFFQEKYGASDRDIFAIGALHRLCCALPLLLVGHLFRRHQKSWLMLFVFIEGIFLVLPGLMPAALDYRMGPVTIPALWAAVIVWLFHDVLGMGIWLPMQQELLQRFSRPEARGKDMSLAAGLGALGGIVAPPLAGWLRGLPGVNAETTVNLPFIVSGAGVMLSAAILLALPRAKDADSIRKDV